MTVPVGTARAASGVPLVLAPADALVSRLRTSARLAVVVGLLLVPAVFANWAFTAVIGGQVAFTAHERDGVVVLRPALLALAETIAGHRADLGALRRAASAHPELELDLQWKAVTVAHGALGTGAGTPGARVALAGSLTELITQAGNTSNLILDPDLDSFYLMDTLVVQIPKAMLSASAVAEVSQYGPRNVVIAAQAVRAGTISGTADAIATDLDTALKNTSAADLKAQLSDAVAFATVLSALATSITDTLDDAEPPPVDATVIAGPARAAIASTLAALDRLLAARVGELADQRVRTLAVSLAALLLACWFSAAFWWRNRRDVQQIVAGVSAIAQNDLHPNPLPDGRDEFGEIARAVAVARQALQEAQLRQSTLEDALTHQAFHDSLTGLANRALFINRAEHALNSQARGGATVTVLLLDLDDFKVVNDTRGHAVGDELLVAVADRVGAAMRAQDTAARLGGDEFAILIEDADEVGVRAVAARLLALLSEPFQLHGTTTRIGACIGVAFNPPEAAGQLDLVELLRRADLALYSGKEQGKNRVVEFHQELHTEMVRRIGAQADLQQALERDELVLHYQPIVSLETGQTTGVEALVRWQHPTRGLVAPVDFIPLAEETGLIVPLGSWVLDTACAQLAKWRRRYPNVPIRMSVNVSSKQVQEGDLTEIVQMALSEHGLPASALMLEITEGVLLREDTTALSTLTALRRLGILIAIDDFGTGYSSLGYLQRFPIDLLKIDRSFVVGLATDKRQDGTPARTVIALAHSLDLKLVAEGVETAAQVEELRQLGCTHGQGYLFSRPRSAADLAGLFGRGGIFPIPRIGGPTVEVPRQDQRWAGEAAGVPAPAGPVPATAPLGPVPATAPLGPVPATAPAGPVPVAD
jgi:diguanylate cyclase (GGDEF)-like protein